NPNLRRAPEDHVGRAEERPRRRKEVRLPAEQVVVLAHQYVDDARLDLEVRVTQAKRGAREERSLRRRGRSARLVAEEVDFDDARRFDAREFRRRELEAEAGVARRRLYASMRRTVYDALQLVGADRKVGGPRSVGSQDGRIARRIAETLRRVPHPIE